MIAAVIAHQGGWDEALMVAAPVVLFVVLLRIANARAGDADADADLDLHADFDPDTDVDTGRDRDGPATPEPPDEPPADRRRDR